MKKSKKEDSRISSDELKFSKQEDEKQQNIFGLYGTPAWLKPENFINSTGTAIGGTISSLDALDESMKHLQNQAIARLQPGLDKHLSEFYEPIKTELETTRNQIEETKSSLGNMKAFIEDNKEALTNLISVNGKMTGLESQVNSALYRLEKLEENRSEKWNKNTTIISLLFGFISLCIGLAGIIVAVIALN